MEPVHRLVYICTCAGVVFMIVLCRQSSPPQLCPPGRTPDGDAIVDIIDSARTFVHVAVMDYYPMLIYDQFTYVQIT